ncbi:C40 family peptidase [Edwardsiella tarda]|uniref:C40 family peptidase n=1 Tax=Edwardsiella tarda TaxID=636 RepID=UPI002443A5C5|nr:C40 family peptidase [Edwardsiella tarda]WGE30533.1 C40 family peptidase [Edwardsiella tarda]
MFDDNLIAYASRCAPAEACGYVVRTQHGDIFLPFENHSVKPTQYFSMTPEDYLHACNIGEVIALVHSHPDGEPFLSTADRHTQLGMALPWWLVCNRQIYKFRCVPPLLGRKFMHGNMDCYTLFRDAYELAGINLPDFPREDDWWRHGQDLYLDNLPQYGFSQVSADAAQPGDLVLCCFGSSVANHAALLCDDGVLLHHLPYQLSKRERYSDKWLRRTHSIWRHEAWQPMSYTGIYNDLVVAYP